MVDVVQLVEHRIVVPSVVGSSPIIHPKLHYRTGLTLRNSAQRYPIPKSLPSGEGLLL